MLDVMYDLPQQDDVSEVVIDSAAVSGKRRPTIKRLPKASATANAA